MNLRQFVTLIPEFDRLEESSFVVNGNELAYHSSVLLKNNYCLGTGFGRCREMARVIGLSEAIERTLVLKLINGHQQRCYLLDEYPTSCGFAVGTTDTSARDRAVAEAVERWLRSKWIDDGFALTELSFAADGLSDLELWFARQFQKVRLFVNSTSVELNGRRAEVHSVVVVGLSSAGAFVGSKTSVDRKAPLLSALVEAWRHLRLALEPDDPKFPELAIIKFFALNRKLAEKQISSAVRQPFPEPKLRLLKEVKTGIEGVFCYRALCENYRGWHGPEVKRFVY